MTETAERKVMFPFSPGDAVAVRGAGFIHQFGHVIAWTKDGTRLWVSTWAGKKIASRPEELEKIREVEANL